MSLFLFDKRHKLGLEFEQWAKENKVLNCPESVITWLSSKGLINEQRALKHLGNDLPKLVRDKTPEMIRDSGKKPIFFPNPNHRYELLLDKLQEGVNDLVEATRRPDRVEATCELFEVISSILDELSPNFDWYETLQKQRRDKGRYCGSYVLQKIVEED